MSATLTCIASAPCLPICTCICFLLIQPCKNGKSATMADAEDPSAAAAPAPAAQGFKQRKNRGNIRKRPTEGEEETAAAAEDETTVVRKAKQQRGDPLAFSTRKEAKQEEVGVTYSSVAGALAAKDTTATRALETETEYDRDARALREAVLKQGVEGPKADNQYRGMKGYVDYKAGFRREHTVGGEKGTGAHGPLRGSAYVRTTARFDYQPDICKDYKETGFCSYGDSCKFLHDRGDYKSGWELEREWEEEQKRRQEALTKGIRDEEEGEEGGSEEEEEEEDDLPFACYICREAWQDCKSDPVVTKCKHYFCENCALKHHAKKGKCAVCEEPTSGIFNVATDIIRKMKKSKGKG